MIREDAIQEINDYAIHYKTSFKEAVIDIIYTFYEAAGFCKDQLDEELGKMDNERLFDACISVFNIDD